MKLSHILTEIKHPRSMGFNEFQRWRDRGDVDPRLSDEDAISQYDHDNRPRHRADQYWEDREARAKARATKAKLYDAQVKKIKAYLETNNNNFVQSVLNRSKDYGSFTENQWRAIEKIIKQADSPESNPAPSISPNDHLNVLQMLVDKRPDNNVFSTALKLVKSGKNLDDNQLKSVRHQMYKNGFKDKANLMK